MPAVLASKRFSVIPTSRPRLWVVGQPQLMFDPGRALNKMEDKLSAGIEWQFRINEQGEQVIDENALQTVIVWRF